MINKDSDFDELVAEYLQRLAVVYSNTQNMPESFYNRLSRNLLHNFGVENKLVNKIVKYRLKSVKRDIRKEYGLWSRFKRWLGFAPKLEAKQASAELSPTFADKIPDEQLKLEQENKELKLQLEQATNNLLQLQQQMQGYSSISYEE